MRSRTWLTILAFVLTALCIGGCGLFDKAKTEKDPEATAQCEDSGDRVSCEVCCGDHERKGLFMKSTCACVMPKELKGK